MSIRVALNHKTHYQYDRAVEIFPQIVRLRPAPHCRTPIASYSLRVEPEQHFLNWQQDPHGNYLARLVFPEKARRVSVEVDLVAEMTVINPFDFFLEPSAEDFRSATSRWLAEELKPYLADIARRAANGRVSGRRESRAKCRTVDFLVEAESALCITRIKYLIRLEPGVQLARDADVGQRLVPRFGLAAGASAAALGWPRGSSRAI